MYGPTYAPYTISTGTNVPSASASCSGLQSCLGGGSTQVQVPVRAPKRNCATQMPVKPYHVTWGPDTHIQHTEELALHSGTPPPQLETIPECEPRSRNNAHTQTAQNTQQHKESSV